MAGDRAQFEKATTKWEQLHQEGLYSMRRDLGSTAIMYASSLDEEDPALREREQWYFKNEAAEIAERLGQIGLRSYIKSDFTADDLGDAIRDREVSSLVLIGHGTLSKIFLTGDHGLVDWRSVSEMSDHLKTGTFIQRHCGRFSNDAITVPLGSFAMARHDNVYAPVGQNFSPENASTPMLKAIEESKIRKVTNHPKLNYDWLKQHFRYQPITKIGD